MADEYDELMARITAEANRAASLGLVAGVTFLTARIRVKVSVQAPTKLSHGATTYYRSRVPALLNAPPRRVSGKLANSVAWAKLGEFEAVVGTNAKSPRGFNYPKHHEIIDPTHPRSGKHQFIAPTIQENMDELVKIIGDTFHISFGG